MAAALPVLGLVLLAHTASGEARHAAHACLLQHQLSTTRAAQPPFSPTSLLLREAAASKWATTAAGVMVVVFGVVVCMGLLVSTVLTSKVDSPRAERRQEGLQASSTGSPHRRWAPVREAPVLLGRTGAETGEKSSRRRQRLAESRAAPAAVDSADKEFCPDLVVPPGCECTLLVPVHHGDERVLDIADEQGLTVLRVQGRGPGRGSGESGVEGSPTGSPAGSRCSPAFGVERSARAGHATTDILLLTTSGEELASCRWLEGGLAHADCEQGSVQITSSEMLLRARVSFKEFPAPELELLRASGVSCGRLVATGGGRYLLSLNSGASLEFWGSVKHYAVNVTDDTGSLLATTELCKAQFNKAGEFYRLRVAPLADVGMILCCLHGIHSMQEMGV